MLPDNQSEWPSEAPAAAPPPFTPHAPPRVGGRSRSGLAATVVGVALLGALIGVAADRWAISNFAPAPPGAVAPTVSTGPRTGPVAAPDGSPRVGQSAPTTSDPTQQAIEQVIQQGDQEQAQAFASNDPTLMQDTSTSDFYQTQVSTNQDLRSNGVTEIKLVSIDWGQISVNGTTATATAFETWSTTYSDGTTEQSRDRNVYTLVQDNGAWKVSADDHPDDNVGGGAPGGSAPGRPGATQPGEPGPPGQPTTPRAPRGQDTSRNWSGYSATGGSFTAVSGTWSVPRFTPDSSAGADATWVGIGGVTSRDLIQAGTQQTVTGSGATQYQAWVETLPQTSHPVPLTVDPGDSVSISIDELPNTTDQWQVSFTNNTTGQTYQVTEHYASSLSSAEWIEEAPSAARGRQLPLDNFGAINFSQASAVKDGQTVTPAAASAQPISMVGRGGQVLVNPSALGPDGASFTISQS